jgi:hypothetical protein
MQLEYDILTDLFISPEEPEMHLQTVNQIDKIVKNLTKAQRAIYEQTNITQDKEGNLIRAVGQWEKELYDLITLRAIPFQDKIKQLKLSNEEDQADPNVDNNESNSFSPHAMFNMSEGFAYTKIKKHENIFAEHNKEQMTRVYPRGTRIMSSNFNPLFYWHAGCQLVSMNYQLLDWKMRFTRAIFNDNRACGYVLKREFRDDSHSKHKNVRVKVLQFFPNFQDATLVEQPDTCTVEIASKQSIWRLEEHRVPIRDLVQFGSKPLELSIKDENVTGKDWKQDSEHLVSFSLMKKKTKLKRLFHRMTKGGDYECLAFESFPVDCTKLGYRYIPLVNKQTQVVYGMLLCHFDKE